MKSPSFLLLAFLLSPFAAFAQGPLIPPAGPPAPSMKTLDQIEARTPIESLPYVISAPGSYYLTKNLQFTATSGDAIRITSPNVTLDLGGFTLSSTAAVTGRAIFVTAGLNNIAIKNGNIAGTTTVSPTWTVAPGGFENGLEANASAGFPFGAFRNMTVENLQVSGCRSLGIIAYFANVTNSTVSSNGTEGLIVSEGNVTGCIAKYNGNNGIIAATVTSSTSRSNAGNGITANAVTGSMATANGHDGIYSVSGSVTGCSAQGNHVSIGTYYDLNATDSVIASTKYGTGNVTGSPIDGERRAAIDSLPVVISAPGSYYLTKSLEFTATLGDAIRITSPNVTLDLGGFTLSSTATVTGRAIFVTGGLNNIAVKNGNIAGTTTVSPTWTVTPGGFENGLDANASSGAPFGAFRNMTVENLQVSGCRSLGIIAYFANVTNSTVSSNGTEGLIASEGNVTGCIAKYNGNNGIIAATVTSSTSRSNAGNGITANTVTGSTSLANGHDGIYSVSGSVTGCTAQGNHVSAGTYYDLNATDAVVAFTRYGTGNTTGSTLTGNKSP